MGKEMNKFKFGDHVWHQEHGFGVIFAKNKGENTWAAFKDGTEAEYSDDELDSSTKCEISLMTDWVKCSERMPDFNVRVLVASGNRFSHDFLLNMDTHTEWASLENWEYWMLAPDMPEEKE